MHQLRHESEVGAMGQRKRLGNRIKGAFRRICCRMQENEVSMEFSDYDLEEGSGGIKQYRLQAARTVRRMIIQFHFIHSLTHCTL